MHLPTHRIPSSFEIMTTLPVSVPMTVLGPDSLSITASRPNPADLEVAVSDIRPHDRDPMEGGGYSDVWRADWTRDGVTTVVGAHNLCWRFSKRPGA